MKSTLQIRKRLRKNFPKNRTVIAKSPRDYVAVNLSWWSKNIAF